MSFDKVIRDFLDENTKEMAKEAAERIRSAAPRRSGRLKDSIDARGTEIFGVDYALILNNKTKFISNALEA